MSTLSEHVSLTITQDSVGIARAGFGIPLILSHTVSWNERVRFYGSLPDVADDFATGTPEYLAATAMFSQSPHVEQIAIGRGSNKPTQVYVITVATVTNSYIYSINVAGPGFTVTNPVTYTSDSTATNDEIVAGLVSALNGVTGKNYTATATGSAGSQVVTVTATAPGNWFSLEVVKVADLHISQTHADPGVAADLDAILLENSDWYAITTLYNSSAYVAAVATWVEANTKLYIFDTNDTNSITVAAGGGDILDALHTATRARTAGAYHPSPANMFAAAWLGRVLPLDPGSETWKFKTLSGVLPVTLTSTHRVNLRAKKANTYQAVAGRNITWEGTVADGDFIDTTRGIDWLEDDMQKGVFGALANSDKIPYTNAGVAVITSEVEASLKRAVAKGILSDDPKPIVTAPKVADIDPTNKAARNLPDVKFSGELAGAIHKVTISGVISV